MTVGALLRTALQLLEGQPSAEARAAIAAAAAADEANAAAPGSSGGGPGAGHAGGGAGVDFDIEAAVGRPEARGADAGSSARSEWLAARREGRCIDIAGDAMAPVVADRASVAYSAQDESPEQLHNKLVVVWIDGQPVVRWFQHCGRYALLRAENADTVPQQRLVDLEDAEHPARFRRVLWINTPH